MNLVFLFVLMSLFAFRVQRIWTTDTWYPSERFREFLKGKKDYHEVRASAFLGIKGASPNELSQGNRHLRLAKVWQELNELFTCPWCSGFWTSVLTTFVIHFFFVPLPLPLLWPFAISAVVGLLGTYDGS